MPKRKSNSQTIDRAPKKKKKLRIRFNEEVKVQTYVMPYPVLTFPSHKRQYFNHKHYFWSTMDTLGYNPELSLREIDKGLIEGSMYIENDTTMKEYIELYKEELRLARQIQNFYSDKGETKHPQDRSSPVNSDNQSLTSLKKTLSKISQARAIFAESYSDLIKKDPKKVHMKIVAPTALRSTSLTTKKISEKMKSVIHKTNPSIKTLPKKI